MDRNAKRSLINAKGNIPDKECIGENKYTLQDESGYRMQLEEVSFKHIGLKWGSYINPQEKILSFHPEQKTVVSHFRMSDPAFVKQAAPGALREKQFVVYREAAEAYELLVPPTMEQPRSFFELQLSESFFENLFTGESAFLSRFQHDDTVNQPSFDFTAQMLPAMYKIIGEMKHAPYNGSLKGMYLEAKAIELFLMQVSQLDSRGRTQGSGLRTADIEALHAVKDKLDAGYEGSFSIAGLARMVGINQTKLKNGFKELFGMTVFGYLAEQRLQEAWSLLEEEQLPVGEVAYRIGYVHPHHFTTAFRKKFGILPGSLKK